MIELKKSELELVLLHISTVNPETGKLVSGLLNENITLGTRRGLQKIHKLLLAEYKQLITDVKTIEEECKEDVEKREKELKELIDETVKVDADPIKLASLDNVSTSVNYNFEIIEKIAV